MGTFSLSLSVGNVSAIPDPSLRAHFTGHQERSSRKLLGAIGQHLASCNMNYVVFITSRDTLYIHNVVFDLENEALSLEQSCFWSGT
jgi:hypothetical protein